MRRKLKLNLEDLQVESFDVSHVFASAAPGTVVGRATQVLDGCDTSYAQCGQDTTLELCGGTDPNATCGTTNQTNIGCWNDTIMTCPCEFCYGPTHSCAGGGTTGDTSHGTACIEPE